ncbi:hypothetical protein SUDANB145_04367 [Streptomyces sp. enrichment culture]|uniref:hypothetical protein n=1 Tax=Streptomyces sp. enrichment culture TaxID=1795815 RepID=UPI003F555911
MSAPETDWQRTYRQWFEHARGCEVCGRVATVAEGCDTGRELWGAYRLARVGGDA